MRKQLSLFLLAALAGLGQAAESALPVPAVATNRLSLQAVIHEANERNPSLKSARTRWEAAKARLRQAGAWADTKFGVDLERSDTTRFATFTDAEWMIAQEVPVSGKNRLRVRAVQAEAAAVFAELRRRELDLTARARIAYSRLANAHAQLDLNRNNDALLRQVIELTRIRYEAGARMQSDVLIAETEQVKNEEVRRDLEREVSDAQSQLNVLMDRPATNALAAPEPNIFREFPFRPNDVEAAALQLRPELQGASNRIAAAKAQHDLARRAWVPDPELRVEARQYNGSGIIEYDTGVFFNLPWVNPGKYRSAIAEAKLNRESAEHDLAALQAETSGMLREQGSKIATFRHHYTLFRERLVPLAQQALEATRIAYQNDKASLLELLTTQRTLRDTESTVQRYLMEYLTALAELESITGARLETLTSSKP
jgi:outer membrane protein TolC